MVFKEVTVFYPDGIGSLCCEILLLICSVLLNNAQVFYSLEGTVNAFNFLVSWIAIRSAGGKSSLREHSSTVFSCAKFTAVKDICATQQLLLP